mmetsp:Transcript_20987/g.31886  ORF Transcript_20987/g.31886 Transcript_20987/m.31886 type:complete len:175 (-) Transcript_20987:326-850(-)
MQTIQVFRMLIMHINKYNPSDVRGIDVSHYSNISNLTSTRQTFQICSFLAICFFVISCLHTSNLEHGVSSKGRYGSRNIGGGAERNDCDHSKTSIVQFTVLLNLQLIILYGGEVNRRENNGGEVSSLGVVDSLGLRYKLGKKDGEVDLVLSTIGDGIPGIKRLHGRKALEGNSG